MSTNRKQIQKKPKVQKPLEVTPYYTIIEVIRDSKSFRIFNNTILTKEEYFRIEKFHFLGKQGSI